jgi:hypothetical protein
LEDEYARKLLSLSRKPLGSAEGGTLKLSLDVIKAEVEAMGKSHQANAAQMKTELEEPLAAFAGSLKERRKIVQGGIEKLLKTKMQQTNSANRARDKYEQDCLKIKGYLAQGHMVMGQEERKNKTKLEKTQAQVAGTSSEYMAAVKILEETTGRWNRDWKAACDVGFIVSRSKIRADRVIEIPGLRRRASRLDQEQPMGLCQHLFNRLCQRRRSKYYLWIILDKQTNAMFSPARKFACLSKTVTLKMTL